ncbi:MAG: hypothetical protein BWY03_00599 [Parcubacteria group bacterium ADurb.Bin159]|jgi:hypothetical protein|nr:MAG: hypothetical protein BWY03_00599 [Parcubacteria group bacterium ADurb.Bin159]
MLNILIGIGLIIVGFLITVNYEWMLRNFGRIEWAETHLYLEGGSRFAYKIIGILIIFVGLLVTTGLFEGVMEKILSPLLPR